MTDPFEPPDDATPDTRPTPPTHFGLTDEQWELQGPQETQRAPSPNHYPDPWAAPVPTGFGYNSAVHPAPPPIPAWIPTPTNGLATAGMVLGIVGACLFWVPVVNGILAILAVVLGGVGWSKSRQLNGLGKGKGITGVVLGVITLIGWFVFWAAVLGSAGTAASSALAAIPEPAVTATYWNSGTTKAAEPVPVAATAKDFKITLKTTDKQCFDTAGCNLSYEADLSYVGPASRKPGDGDSYQVTYDVTGGNTGTITGTIITDGSQSASDTGFTSTDRNSVKLRAKITDVTKAS